MFRSDYKNELNKIKASEKFKEETISLLNQKQSDKDNCSKKIIIFRKKNFIQIASCIAIIATCISMYIYNDKLTAKFTERYTIEPSSNISKDFSKDSYNIKDAEDLKPIKNKKNNKTKFITGNKLINRTSYSVNSPQEINQNQIYSTNDIFENLQVYKSNFMSIEQVYNTANKICKSLNLNDDVDFTWRKYSYNGNEDFYIDKEFHTNSITCPESNSILCSAYKDFDNGSFKIDALNRTINITINNIILEHQNKEEIVNSIIDKFNEFSNKSNITYYNQYNSNVDTKIDTYIYETSENYSDNVFNLSLNNTHISLYKNDVDSDSYTVSIDMNYYNNINSQELPAINYKEALSLLYKKQYITLESEEITNESIVKHIDLVYKDSCYNSNEKAFLSIPFYKFFVETQNKENSIQSEDIKTYSTYYVCAIHPNFIEIE